MRAEFGHEVAFGEDILTFTIEGNAFFLHSMVRTIVGTLVEIGMHRREPEWMREVIDACDRTAAGPTAPACGLTFMGVDYDPPSLSCSTRGRARRVVRRHLSSVGCACATSVLDVQYNWCLIAFIAGGVP